MFKKNNKRNSSTNRPIDNLVDDIFPKWKRTVVYMKKTQVKTWQGAIILAFVGGLAAAAIWIARIDGGIFSQSAGASATLSLKSGSSNTLTVTQGANFSVDVILNTNSSSVVAVNAVVQYNATNFQLVGAPNVGASIFNNAGDNACVSQAQAQGKLCNIIDTATAGKVSIAMAKPTPGVNTSAGLVTTLTFKALRTVTANSTDIKMNFIAIGNYTDSDAIADDGVGADILQSVGMFTIAVNPPTCTSFTYSAWGTCQPDSTQTRTISTSVPSGCTGGSPALTQSCTYVPPTCTSFTYSAWGTCQPDSTQTRTISTSTPSGCTGGNPALTQSCTYVPPTCTSFTYSAWGTCQPDSTQSRTISISSPVGCAGGSPILTQSCTYVGGSTTCTSFTYSTWGTCQSNNTQARTALTSTPADCIGGSPTLTQTCTYVPPTCTSFNYSAWGACQPDGNQTRNILTSTPADCIGGSPSLTQSCAYVPPTCTSFNYSAWGACQPDGNQTRNILTSTPSVCIAGNPTLTQTCSYVPPTCNSFTYSAWGICQSDSTQTRSVETSAPSGCSGGNSIISQSCNYIAPIVVQQPVSVTQTTVVASSTVEKKSSQSHHKKETKKKKKSNKIANSPKTIKRGAVLVQSGAYFTKNSKLLVYFGNGKGGYYSPKTVYANAKGKFSIAYRMNKLPGKYSWYVIATNTGRKSNIATYTVK